MSFVPAGSASYNFQGSSNPLWMDELIDTTLHLPETSDWVSVDPFATISTSDTALLVTESRLRRGDVSIMYYFTAEEKQGERRAVGQSHASSHIIIPVAADGTSLSLSTLSLYSLILLILLYVSLPFSPPCSNFSGSSSLITGRRQGEVVRYRNLHHPGLCLSPVPVINASSSQLGTPLASRFSTFPLTLLLLL